MADLKTLIDKKIEGENKFLDLYNALITSKYISTSMEVFNSVMLYKKLPGDANKIQWLTTKADAIYFQKSFKFSMPQFNECFFKDKYPFQLGSKPTTNRKRALTNIIDRYKE